MKVLDSSVWLELVEDGPLAGQCAAHVADLAAIVTPMVVLLEVYRALRRGDRDAAAMTVVGEMEFTEIVPIDSTVAIVAADLSIDHRLAMADALVYATARLRRCDLVTTDGHFRDLPGVTLIEATS